MNESRLCRFLGAGAGLARRMAGHATLMLALAPAIWPSVVSAQTAWVPGKGNGSFALAVGNLFTDEQFTYRGDAVSAGESSARIVFLSLDYGLTDRLAVTLAIPFIEKKYEGMRPHTPGTLDDVALRDLPFLDDGNYHGGWQDFSLKLRYNLKAEPVSITPYVALNVPSHDYIFFAQSAIGTQQRNLQFGIDLGGSFEPPLQNFYWQGGYGYSIVEQVRDVNVNFSTVKLELGYLLNPQWSVKLLAHAQKTHGGLDFPVDFVASFTNDQWFHHDQIQRTDFLNVGFGVDYRLSGNWGVFGSYGTTVWGENTYVIDHAVTVGLARSF